MASISSPGIGSGLDIAGIVNQLVAAEGQPTTLRLDRREAGFQAKISALGTFKSALSDFQSKLAQLNTVSSFQKRSVSSGDQAVFGVSAGNQAAAANYAVNVTSLAQAHTLVTDETTPFASATEIVGTGTLTFRFGSNDHDPVGDTYTSFTQNTGKGTHTLTIDSSNNTLTGLRDAINDGNFGVRASIINNGSGYLLAMTSTSTGADSSINIEVNDTGDAVHTDANGLSRLAFNTSASNMVQTKSATNAALTIDGVAITSATNTISDALDDVTLTLKGTGTTTLDVALDKTGVKGVVNNFVSSYNSLASTIDSLTGYNAETGVGGTLIGDAGVRNIAFQVRSMLGNVVDDLGGPFTSLGDIGITADNKGKLSVDSSVLQDALDNNFDDVADLFAAVGRPDDVFINFTSATDDTKAGQYAVNISQLATQGSINGATTAALADDGAGNFSSAFVVDDNNDTFTLTIDGVTSNNITLTQGSYATTAELVAELQSRINADSALSGSGVTAVVSFDSASDRLVVSSERYGSASRVAFTSGDANVAAQLGFDSALSGTDGVDVAGTIDGLAATGSGRFLTGAGDATGLKIEITGGALGDRDNVTFSRGIADQINTYLSSLLDGDVLDDRISGLNTSIENLSDQRAVLDRRLENLQARLLKQFTALDSLISQMNTTSSFLTQQLSSLPGISTRSGG